MQCKNHLLSRPSAWLNEAQAGTQIKSNRIAACSYDRSNDTLTYKRGMDAHNHPGFYRQLGQDPERLTAVALQLLKLKFLPRNVQG